MNWARALAFGIAGALLGGAIWVAIGYFTGYELGFLAIGVGVACGVGVALGAQGRAGVQGGILAAALAVVAIVVARYFIVKLSLLDLAREAMADYGDASPGSGDDEYWIAVIADQLIENMGEDAEYLEWPIDDESWEDDSVANDYPSEIWAEALSAWRGMSALEREQFCTVARNEMERDAEAGMGVAAGIVTLISCLRPMSLLFLAMAVGTAYKVAANSRPVNESPELQSGAMVLDDDKLHATPSWLRAAPNDQVPRPAAPASPPIPPTASQQVSINTSHPLQKERPGTAPGQPFAPRQASAPSDGSFFIPGLGPAQLPHQHRNPDRGGSSA